MPTAAGKRDGGDALRRALVRAYQLAAVFLTIALPAAVSAQVVRGTVVDAANLAVPGVVVAMLDSSEAVVARALTNELGEYRLVAPRGGTYRLRTLRIGYQPTMSSPITVAAGELASARLTLDGVRVALETVRVQARSSCGKQSDANGDSFVAWDQAMTSVSAASLTASGRGLTATVMQIERVLDPDGRRIRSQTASVRTDYVTQPWRSLSPDTLRRRGYKEIDANDVTTFHVPGLDVLVSPFFLQDHCVHVVAARDTAEIGVAFEPVPERFRRSEIRGTLWMQKSSAVLRRMEFVFTALPGERVEYPAGGSMTFTRMPEGAMVISSWELRMPRLEKETPTSPKIRVAAVEATGGRLVVLRRGTDTLFSHPTIAVTGWVTDSASGNAVANALLTLRGTTLQVRSGADGRFGFDNVLPGEYALAVSTPSLDSIRASSQSSVLVMEGMTALRIKVPTSTQLAGALCGTQLSGAAGRGKGAVLGTVRESGDTTMLARVRVVADWRDVAVRGSGIQQQSKRLETTSDSTGSFRLCGVPTETAVTLRAMTDRGRAQVVSMQLTADQRFASTVLLVDRAKSATASFVGTVVADSTLRVLADAEVSIPDLALTTRSNQRGEFRLNDIPAGAHEILARRLGFGAITATITFTANDEEERRLVLRPLTVLDSVEVVATRIDRDMLEFEENRKVGLGHFITREDLDKNRNLRMGDRLSMVSGVGIVRATSGPGYAWLLSKRFVVPLCAVSQRCDGSIYWPNATDSAMGIKAGCYAQVWVDRILMNAGSPTPPFDVNSISPEQIEAVEWYASAAQTPSRYARLNGNCGVLVIHRRRN